MDVVESLCTAAVVLSSHARERSEHGTGLAAGSSVSLCQDGHSSWMSVLWGCNEAEQLRRCEQVLPAGNEGPNGSCRTADPAALSSCMSSSTLGQLNLCSCSCLLQPCWCLFNPCEKSIRAWCSCPGWVPAGHKNKKLPLRVTGDKRTLECLAASSVAAFKDCPIEGAASGGGSAVRNTPELLFCSWASVHQQTKKQEV